MMYILFATVTDAVVFVEKFQAGKTKSLFPVHIRCAFGPDPAECSLEDLKGLGQDYKRNLFMQTSSEGELAARIRLLMSRYALGDQSNTVPLCAESESDCATTQALERPFIDAHNHVEAEVVDGSMNHQTIILERKAARWVVKAATVDNTSVEESATSEEQVLTTERLDQLANTSSSIAYMLAKDGVVYLPESTADMVEANDCQKASECQDKQSTDMLDSTRCPGVNVTDEISIVDRRAQDEQQRGIVAKEALSQGEDEDVALIALATTNETSILSPINIDDQAKSTEILRKQEDVDQYCPETPNSPSCSSTDESSKATARCEALCDAQYAQEQARIRRGAKKSGCLLL